MIALLFTLALSNAYADVPPPEAEACSGKEVGAHCPDATSSGRCVESTCTRPTPDGESEYGCIVCKFGTSGAEPDELPPSKGCGCDQNAPGGASVVALAALGIALRRARARR